MAQQPKPQVGPDPFTLMSLGHVMAMTPNAMGGFGPMGGGGLGIAPGLGAPGAPPPQPPQQGPMQGPMAGGGGMGMDMPFGAFPPAAMMGGFGQHQGLPVAPGLGAPNPFGGVQTGGSYRQQAPPQRAAARPQPARARGRAPQAQPQLPQYAPQQHSGLQTYPDMGIPPGASAALRNIPNMAGQAFQGAAQRVGEWMHTPIEGPVGQALEPVDRWMHTPIGGGQPQSQPQPVRQQQGAPVMASGGPLPRNERSPVMMDRDPETMKPGYWEGRTVDSETIGAAVDQATESGQIRRMLKAIAEVESHGLSSVNRDKKVGGEQPNATGVFQITPKTARALGFTGADSDLLDPFIGAKVGVQVLEENLKRTKGNERDAISMFFSGQPYARLTSGGEYESGTNYGNNQQYVHKVEAAMQRQGAQANTESPRQTALRNQHVPVMYTGNGMDDHGERQAGAKQQQEGGYPDPFQYDTTQPYAPNEQMTKEYAQRVSGEAYKPAMDLNEAQQLGEGDMTPERPDPMANGLRAGGALALGNIGAVLRGQQGSGGVYETLHGAQQARLASQDQRAAERREFGQEKRRNALQLTREKAIQEIGIRTRLDADMAERKYNTELDMFKSGVAKWAKEGDWKYFSNHEPDKKKGGIMGSVRNMRDTIFEVYRQAKNAKAAGQDPQKAVFKAMTDYYGEPEEVEVQGMPDMLNRIYAKIEDLPTRAVDENGTQINPRQMGMDLVQKFLVDEFGAKKQVSTIEGTRLGQIAGGIKPSTYPGTVQPMMDVAGAAADYLLPGSSEAMRKQYVRGVNRVSDRIFGPPKQRPKKP